MPDLPRLLITLGDVAGIGPEIAVRAWREPRLHESCVPVLVGDVDQLRKSAGWLHFNGEVHSLDSPDSAAPSLSRLECVQATDQDLSAIRRGRVDAAAGRAAFDFLCRAIDLTLSGRADGIVTLPLHKEGLRAAGLAYPGHTEILAERTGTQRYAMALYVPGTHSLAVTHVTLHLALRDVFSLLRPEAILEKTELTATMLRKLGCNSPRIGVCGLNPHAGDGGLFGDEEERLIRPAIEVARGQGIEATGPWPSDTLFSRAFNGEFDGIVAMYHDQGHIAVKLMSGHRAVNVTLGLPIVRTSVAHGTAYDIAGQGVADCQGLLEAVCVAARLVHSRRA